jgi:small subunit ribosomal protein S3Ae
MLKGRVFELNLADLNKDEDHAYRKFQLQCEEVQGRYCLTQFYGMDFTTDKLRSLVRKWQSLIEANVDVKTADGYVLRLFCIGFTKKRNNQLKKTCYANSSQQKLIRKKMRDIMTTQATSCELQELVNKFIPEVIGKEIEKACHGVYPLQNCHIRKVKMLKKPKFDLTKLLDIHGDGGLAPVTDDKGEAIKVADLGEGAEQQEVVGA